MEFSSRTWHIRLIRFFRNDYTPTDLCSHFWTVVFTVLVGAPIILLFAIIAGVPLLLGIAIGEGGKKISNALSRHKAHRESYQRPEEPSLISSWLYSKKRRICPMITVREEHD